MNQKQTRPILPAGFRFNSAGAERAELYRAVNVTLGRTIANYAGRSFLWYKAGDEARVYGRRRVHIREIKADLTSSLIY